MVTIIISLSLIIALTLTPMMSSGMLRATKDITMNGFDRWYSQRILPCSTRSTISMPVW